MKSQITEVIEEVPEMTEQSMLTYTQKESAPQSLEAPHEILLEYSSNSGVEGVKKDRNNTQIETGPRSMNFN